MSTALVPYVKRSVVPNRRYLKRRVKVRPRRYKKRRMMIKPRSMKPYTRFSKMPIAERYFCKMNYSDNITISCTSPGVLFGYQFQTSLWDPDWSGVGHQPLYRDQLAVLYNRYRVFGIKYEICWRNTNVSQLTWGYVKHTDTTTVDTNPNTLAERKEGRMVYLDSLYSRSNVMRGYLATNKPFGLSKREFYDDEDFIANVLSDPAKKAYLQLYAMTLNTTAIVQVQVNLTLYTEWIDRAEISGS